MNKDVEKNLRGQIRKLRKKVKQLDNKLWACSIESRSWGFIIDDLAEKVFAGDKKGLWHLYQRYAHNRMKIEAPEIYKAYVEARQRDMEQNLQSVQDGVTSMMEDGNDER